MDYTLTKSERETLKAIWRLTSQTHLAAHSQADGGARTGVADGSGSNGRTADGDAGGG